VIERKRKADDAKKADQKSGGKRAAIRAASRAKRKAMYAAHFDRVEPNRKRGMRRHLRANPMDEQNARRYEETFGSVKSIGVSARGAKLVKRRERAIMRWATRVAADVPHAAVPTGPEGEVRVAGE
jgi:hypothetical protein